MKYTTFAAVLALSSPVNWAVLSSSDPHYLSYEISWRADSLLSNTHIWPQSSLGFWAIQTTKEEVSFYLGDFFTDSAGITEALNTPMDQRLVAERIVREVWDGEEIDLDSLGALVDPKIIGWNARTRNGQLFVDTTDVAYLAEKLWFEDATALIEAALKFGNQWTDPEACEIVQDQIRRSSGKFARDLEIRDIVSGKNGALLADAMCESEVSGTLEEVIAELGYEISDDTIIYNLFGSGNNPEGTDGWVGIPYRLAKWLQVMNAFITASGELVLNFEACGGNFGVITTDESFISAQSNIANRRRWDIGYSYDQRQEDSTTEDTWMKWQDTPIPNIFDGPITTPVIIPDSTSLNNASIPGTLILMWTAVWFILWLGGKKTNKTA